MMVAHEYEKEVAAEPCNISRVVEETINFLEGEKLTDEELTFRVELALRELMANAIEHGCSDGGNCKIKVNFHCKEKCVTIDVADNGPGFDWEKMELDEMPLLSERGRGLPLVKSMVDKIKFYSPGNRVKVWIKNRS